MEVWLVNMSNNWIKKKTLIEKFFLNAKTNEIVKKC